MKKSVLANAIKLSLIGLSATILLGCNPKTAEQYLAEGQQFATSNNNAAAIVALKNAIQAAPNSGEARFELGKLYIETKQYESAEKELTRALEFGYEPSKVLPLVTQAYKHTGAYSALSKTNFEQEGLSPSESSEIGFFKAYALIKLGKEDEAKTLMAKLANIDTTSIFKGLTAAYGLIIDNEQDAALEALISLKWLAPTQPEVLKTLAQVQLSLNKPQDAANVFNEYAELYPEDLQIKFVLAKLLVDLDRMDEAEPHIDNLLKSNTQNALLNQLKAAVRISKDDFAGALTYAESVILNGSNDPSVRLIAGYSAYRTNDFASTNKHLSYIASQLPDNHPALRLLADSQLRLNLTSEAGRILSRIDDLGQDDVPLLSKASYQLLRDGYEKDARELVNKSSGLSEEAEDLTRLGLLQLSLNNIDGIVNLEEAVAKDPEVEDAQSALASAYIASGQYDKALALANEWKSQSPNNNIKPYMISGQVFLQQNNVERAKAEFKQALALDDKAPEPQMELINIAISENKLTDASEKINELLKQEPSYLPALAANFLLLQQNGEGEKGITRIKQVAGQRPKDINLRLLLARIYNADQKFDNSLEVLNAVANISEQLPKQYWELKGQALVANNNISEAEKHYDAWLTAYPNDKEATMSQLLLLDREGKFAEGVGIVKSWLEKRDDLQMQILLTHFLIMNADLTAAKEAYKTLPAGILKAPMVRGFLANFQMADNKPEQALPNALAAYEDNKDYKNVVLVTYIYERLKQKENSVKFLQAHVASKPSDMRSRMLLAEREYSSDSAAAIHSYELAIQANPQNYIALNNLAYLYLQQGQLAKAKDHAQKALAITPTNPAIMDTMGLVLVAEKNYTGALKYYEQVANSKGVTEDMYLNYVEALFLAKQNVLAIRKLEQKEFKLDESLKRINELKSMHNS